MELIRDKKIKHLASRSCLGGRKERKQFQNNVVSALRALRVETRKL